MYDRYECKRWPRSSRVPLPFLRPLHANLSLTKYIEKNTSPRIFQNEFKKLCSSRPRSVHIVFIGGLKGTEGIVAGSLIDGKHHMCSLHEISSVYTA